jgi:PAS domain S-box-containing protein
MPAKPRGPEPQTKKAPVGPRFEKLLAQISTRFIALPSARLDDEILHAQRDVCECLGIDISTLWQTLPDEPRNLRLTHAYVPPDYEVPVQDMEGQDALPWAWERIVKGETVVISKITDLPVFATRDRETHRHYRILSSLSFPLSAGGGEVFGAVAFIAFRRQMDWSKGLIGKLELIAQVFANALFRKRADLALRDREARYRGIFEGSVEGIFRTSPEGRVLVANPALAAMLGYDSPAHLLASVTDLGEQVWESPEDRSRFSRELNEKGVVKGFECRVRRRDGATLWLSLTARRVPGPDGRAAYYEGFAWDVSERRRAELALAESERRYRTLFEVTPVGLSVVGQDGHILMANSLQARLFGYESPQRMEGLFAASLIAGTDRELAERNYAALLGGNDRAEWPLTAVRRDGSMFPAEVRAVAIRGADGEVQGHLFLTRDLTKSLQDENERNQLRLELTHLSRILTVDTISTSLAHEINQPLGAVLNNAEAARTLLSRAGGDKGSLPEIVEDIIEDTRRAADVVRKVRRVLKKSDSRFERLSVNAVIEETLEFLRNSLALNNVTLRTELGPALADVRGDQIRLQQVLLNLVTNALEAMKDVSSRTLTVRSAMAGPGEVTVSVGDSGPGVPGAHRDSVFDPFFTTKSGGLGLGLSICRSIVEEHGGRIWQAGGPDGGATFCFSLRAWRAGEAQD